MCRVHVSGTEDCRRAMGKAGWEGLMNPRASLSRVVGTWPVPWAYLHSGEDCAPGWSLAASGILLLILPSLQNLFYG